MSTNTTSPTHYHPATLQRKLDDYADIINQKRPLAPHPMSAEARAAQFAPYAALVGHKDIISADEDLANQKNQS